MAAKFKFLRPSSARLAALYVLLFSIGVCTLLGAVYFLTARVLDRETDAVIDTELENLRDAYNAGGLEQLTEVMRLHMDDWRRTGSIYLLTDSTKKRIAGNLSQWPKSGVTDERRFGFAAAIDDSEGTHIHPIRARTFVLPDNHILLVGTDLQEQQRFFTTLRATLLSGIALCILLAVLIGSGYQSRVRQRVRGIAATCQSVMAGDLSRRLELDGSHDEFDELSTAVNRMLERIEQQTSVLRTTFDSAAHDLRAPLNRARIRLEETLQHGGVADAARATMEATLHELERVQRTLGTLLQIAQAEGQSLSNSMESIDMGRLANELTELYQPEALERGLQLECAAAPAALVKGNRQLLAQAVVNLLENSLKYLPASGHIEVRVTANETTVALTVADDGPGIPAGEHTAVLKPFARLERDRHRPGSGLGLSLVAAVMRLHRGTLELQDNAPGLRVTCAIPRASRNV